MNKFLVIVALTLAIGSGYAATQYIMLKCDADSYTSMLAPDKNYGSGSEVDSQAKFTYSGTTLSDQDTRISYFHYAIPPSIVGKAKVIEVIYNIHVNLYKAISPYKPGRATAYAGLYPTLSTWNEMTITFTNQPGASGPGYYSVDSKHGTYKPTIGWNQFKFDTEGIKLFQKAVNKGVYFGMACYTDVTGPDGELLMAGNYQNLLRVASREAFKKGSYITLGYEMITGNMINGSNVSPATLGEVKASYH